MALHIRKFIILCLSVSVIRIPSNSDRGQLMDVLKIFKGCYITRVEYSNLVPGVETIFEDAITLGFPHKSKHVYSRLRIFEPCGVILIVNPPVASPELSPESIPDSILQFLSRTHMEFTLSPPRICITFIEIFEIQIFANTLFEIDGNTNSKSGSLFRDLAE